MQATADIRTITVDCLIMTADMQVHIDDSIDQASILNQIKQNKSKNATF